MSSSILVIDNDLAYAQTLREYLLRYFSPVHLADTEANAHELISDLVTNNLVPDVAVVNVRLKDESDERDVSGLAIAKKLHDLLVPCVLIAQAFSTQLEQRVTSKPKRGTPLAMALIRKGGGPQILQAAIDATVYHPRLKGF